MGNGPLNQSIGYGEATVFNPNVAVQNFNNIIQQQKAEKAARDQALINQMASIKADGIREGDKGDFQDKYQQWKDEAIRANNLPKNSRQRLDAIASSQQKYNELGEFVGKSKEEKASKKARREEGH